MPSLKNVELWSILMLPCISFSSPRTFPIHLVFPEMRWPWVPCGDKTHIHTCAPSFALTSGAKIDLRSGSG